MSMLSGELAHLPSAAGNAGSLHYATDSGLDPRRRFRWSDGTRWHLVPHVADPRDFGAQGDSVTDDASAFQAAIDSFGDPFKGGVVVVAYSPSGYRFGRTVFLRRGVVIVGEQKGVYGGSQIVVDAGVTAFKVLRSAARQPSGADGEISHLFIAAAGRNQNVEQGSYDHATGTVTLAAAGDFVDGQVIEVPGAARSRVLNGVVADTAPGSPTVTLHSLGPGMAGTAMGVWPGTYLTIGSAFPNPTRVLSVTNDGATNVCRMARNASDRPQPPNVQVVKGEDLLARIVSGGATTALVLDTINNGGQSVAGVTIAHADPAIDIENRFTVRDCHIQGFQGPAVFIAASTKWEPGSNANLWRLDNVLVERCRNALYVIGEDANAGTAIGLHSVQSRKWSIDDQSFLGNTYVAPHCDGGYGYATSPTQACASVLVGPYQEGGTSSQLGPATLVLGGVMGGTTGGNSFVAGRWNRMVIGPAGGSSDQHETTFEPEQYFARYGDPSNGGFDWRRGIAGFEVSHAGWHVFTHEDFRKVAWCVSTRGAPAGIGAGRLWVPRGLLLGDDALATTDDRQARTLTVGDSQPATGTWRQGDIVFNRAPRAGGFVGWVCTSSGTPGAWNSFGLIESDR